MADVSSLMSSLSAEKRALLEKRLMEKRAAAAKQQLIPHRTEQGPCPLSFAQELMWLLDHLIDTSAYHVPRALRMKGPLNVEALEFALNKIVERHEVLRTTYQEVDGHPKQFVSPSAKVHLDVIDLSGMETTEREREAQRILVEEGKRKFDFVHDLMLRAILMRLEKDEHILLLVSHHIASDGQSKAVLFRELKTFYLAHCEGKPVELPPLPIQYSDFSLWQRDWMSGDVLRSHINFWKETLAGAPTLLELPTDNPRPASQGFEGARQFLRCPDGMLENFKALCRKEGSTVFMTMLAAFGTLLWRWSGQEDMLIGTPVSGRSRTELEPLIGYFSNSVVLRMNMGGDPTFRELLKQTKEVALAAYSHQHLPFEKLVTEMQPQRDLSYSPMYQVMFSVGEHKDLGIDLPGMEITPIIIDRGVAKFDMTLGMTELKKDLMCNIEYCSALFEPTTMQRLANQFQNLLQGIVENDSYSPVGRMTLEDRFVADYEATSFTLGQHPMGYKRSVFRQMGIKSGMELTHLANGTWAKTGGQVTCRQRPGTANGTMFLTLEDETGLANIIVPRDTVQEHCATACNSPYVKVEGIVEKDGGVIHLLAKRISPLTVSAAIAPSRDFH